MFRITGGPGTDDLPVVSGVDEFVSKSLLWTLAGAVAPSGERWSTVRPEDIATLLDPSFAHLRADCAAIGQASKFDAAHVASKWPACASKHYQEQAQAEAFVARLTAASDEAKQSADQGLPLALQLDNAYLVLDDRAPAKPIYQGPVGSGAIVALARQLWTAPDGTLRRVLDVPKPSGAGTKAMGAPEFIQAYGRAITGLVTELHATQPRVEDLTLIRPAINADPPDAVFDSDVSEWLETLAGRDHRALLDWIAYAAPRHLKGIAPALTLAGGAHVGKSLLAQGVAAAAGLDACAPLARALGKFGGVIQTHPIVFADEGLPTGPHGRPMTEEFRDLVTRSNHLLELKNLNTNVIVSGGVRVILAANRIDRLFSNRGNLGSDDLAALIRRLLVIDVQGPERIARACAQSRALGAYDNDPARLARVAGHFRWIQETRPIERAPEPSAGLLKSELRRGGDIAATALRALEDAATGAATWLAVDPEPYQGAPGGIAWVQPDAWGRAASLAATSIVRAVAPYVVRPNAQYRRHPITGQRSDADAPRTRWIGLDYRALTDDGISLDPSKE